MFEATNNAGVTLEHGTLIGNRYRVEHALGAGAEGSFYRAVDTECGDRSVVVQCISTAMARLDQHGTEEYAWFLELVSQIQALTHDSLRRPSAAWHEPAGQGAYYLVLDFVPGNTLDQELSECKESLSWRRVVDIGIALAGLLEYLHRRRSQALLGILRPQRVVIDARSGVPIVVAFGLAARLSASTGDRPVYQPIEQWIGRPVPQSDIYALGMILGTLLTTRDPDAEYSHLRRSGLDVQRSMRVAVTELLARLTEVPPSLREVIRRATAFSANDRYASAGDMEAALCSVSGPAVTTESTLLSAAEDTTVWDRLGLTREAFFALPTTRRNALVLRAFERK